MPGGDLLKRSAAVILACRRSISITLFAVATATACADVKDGGKQGNQNTQGIDSAQSSVFTELEVPGATASVASGINSAGDVVGWYHEGERVRGFIYRQGAFTSVDYPDVVFTQLHGIGPDGTIVGAYRKAGETQQFMGKPVAYHGFRLTPSGEFVEVNHPGQKYTIAQRILADGTILGCYHGDDFNESMRGIAIRPGGTSVVEVPATMHNGATPDGRRIVGFDMATSRAYLIADGVFTYFAVPGSVVTEAWDMNTSGTIVGMFVDSGSVTHGFVLQDGDYVSVDYPNAKSTVAFGTNTSGDIVGAFTDASGGRRAYIRKGTSVRE
ncbi:MAG: hypothetical protein WEA80_09470 [Gemmatimonadaceae bacterium]